MIANPTLDTSISAFGCPQGIFKVDASGQAGYRLAIQVPPGAGGLQPQLELAYNHRQANGVLGVGWSIAGLSAISRVKANYTVDGFNGAINYDANDRLVLDGQRLINVDGAYWEAGTVYYTGIHNWKRVRAAASDQGFVVTMKNGEIWRYGCTPDSRIMALGGNQVRVWALQSIEDLNGNRIEFRYTTAPLGGGDDGAYYIERISYTVRDDLAANRFVDFLYEQRPDPIVNYIGGHAIGTNYRLRQIATRLGEDTLVRTYTLAYACGTATNLSRLMQIVDTGAPDAGSPSLPAIAIDWQDTSAPGFASGAGSALDQHLDTVSQLSMDVSGSGRSDVVQLWLDQDKVLNATSYLASGAGAQVAFTRAGVSVLGQFPAECQVFAADLNGDGRTDLLIAYRDGASGNLMLAPFLSNGATFDAQAVHDTGDGWSVDHLGFFAMDVNGDGRTDLVEAFGQHDPARGQLLYFRSYLSRIGDGGDAGFGPALVSATDDPANPTTQLALWPMDVNGDGMVDLVRVWQDGAQGEVHVTSYLSVSHAPDQVYFSAVRDSNLGALALADQLAFLPADVNGDGMMDLLQVWQEPCAGGTNLHLSTFIADGSGGFAAGADSSFPGQTINPNGFYPMGFSGGGQTQLLSKWVDVDGSLMFSVFASSPSGRFRKLVDVNAGPVGATHEDDLLLVGDVNGDGKADLIRVALDEHQQAVAYPYVSIGPYPDLVSAITDQLGAVTSILYAPLSDASVYLASDPTAFPQSGARRYPNALSPTQFPVQAVLGQALYVVASYTQSNDPARNRFQLDQQYGYTYADAKIDMLGRGWLGFATLARLDLKTGLRVQEYMNQQFPLTGTVASVTLEADGRYSDDPRVGKDKRAVLLRRTSSSYDCYVRARGVTPGAPAQPVFEVLPTATRSAYYDYGSDHFDYATGTARAYDDYGNAVRDIDLSYVDPGSGQPLDPSAVVYRYNSYRNDVSADGWALGYLCFTKVSANATDTAIDVFLPGDYRLEQREYLDRTYNLASHRKWDDSNGVFLSTGYEYDRFGKRTAMRQPGGAVTTWDYEGQYHCYLQQTTSPPNADGVRLTTRHGFDPRFGIEVAFRDENGAIFISALDGFGRLQHRQGPIPSQSGLVGDENLLSSLVTGDTATRALFQSAQVCTLESIDYSTDGSGGIARRHARLQSFPSNEQRDFLHRAAYCDPLGREVLVAQESGHSAGDVLIATEYGPNGQVASKSLPHFDMAPGPVGTERYRYDVLGRVLWREQPGGADGLDMVASTWEYDKDGVVILTSAAGTPVATAQRCQYRFFGGESKVVNSTMLDEAGACTVFRYDPLARLLSSTDPATPSSPDGVRTAIAYDSLDRKTSVDNPDQNTTGDPGIKAVRYQYDAATGRLIRETNAAQEVTDYRYDPLGRVVAKACGDGRTIACQYDGAQPYGLARLTRVTIADDKGDIESRRDYVYDCYGNTSGVRLALEGSAADFISRTTFDPQRRVVQHIHPDESVLTRVYRSGMLVEQTLDGAGIAYPLEQYTAAGRFGQTLCGALVDTRYRFSPTSLLYGQSVAKGGEPMLDLAYQYDALNRLRTVTGHDASGPILEQFNYRHRRLSDASLAEFGDTQFTYDAAGNLLTKDGRDYRSKAHFTAEVCADGNEVYAALADQCGRLVARTVDGCMTRFHYDGLGNLRNVTDAAGGIVREMRSDHLGRCLSRSGKNGSTTYIDATFQVTTEGDKRTVTKYLIDGLGIAAAVNSSGGQSSVQYFQRDPKGSVTRVFDAAGALQATLAYDSFGLLRISGEVDPLPPAYEHRQWDEELRLYDFRSRYYDPRLGRFLTPDTQLGSDRIEMPDAWNRYAFEFNNPLNYVDPSGHMASWIGGLLIGLAAVGAGLAIVATGGAATGLAAVGIAALSGALIAGGATAIGYSATHKDNFSWKGFGIQTGIGAGIGALSGGALSALEAPIAASANPVLWTGVTGALAGGAADVSSQFLTNLATGARLSDGLAVSAIFGVVTGGLAGALSAKLAANARAAGEAATRAAEQGEIPLRSYGAIDPLEAEQEALAASTANWKQDARFLKKTGELVTPLTAVPSAIFENESWYGSLS